MSEEGITTLNGTMMNGNIELTNGRAHKEGANGFIHIKNPHISNMDEDVLYHFALGTKSHDLKKMFGDVKFVCIGGSPRRMERFAHFLVKELGYNVPSGLALENITNATDRYAMYKVGPVLSVSHGMGVPSVSIMLHEIIKMMFHAGCTDVEFFRIGTSGGLGLKPGTVVVTSEAVDGQGKASQDNLVLGKVVSRPSVLDKDLAERLLQCSMNDDFEVIMGKTMCTDDFYEGQGRLDGAFCDYNEDEKMAYLQDCHNRGVRNIEMESVCFGSMCHHAGIKCAVVCVTLLDRLQGDQVSTPHDVLDSWSQRPMTIVARHIKNRMKTL
ncbi:unnamed protein product [Owenia fusiformis]|uniref:Nucleoside phosphorylase domain-containing protein n=1 Tax=Owenia fusiformis TaxID=6347 RepID=A0A8S4N1Z4_OWEFU|nr:unnamed protein product [Owenia fusiformis]